MTTTENFIKRAALCRKKINPLPAALSSMLSYAEDNLDLYDAKMGLDEWNDLIRKIEGASEETNGLGRLQRQTENVEVSDALDKIFSIMDKALEQGGYAPKRQKQQAAIETGKKTEDKPKPELTKEQVTKRIKALETAIAFLTGEDAAKAAKKAKRLKMTVAFL